MKYNTRGRKINSKPHDEKVFAKDWQRKILVQNFETDPYPDRKKREALEAELGLTAKWINQWFLTQRKKNREQANRSGDLTNQSSVFVNQSESSNVTELRSKVKNVEVRVIKEQPEEAVIDDDVVIQEEIIEEKPVEDVDMKETPEDPRVMLESLQRRFDELQARYDQMAQLLMQRSVIKEDDKAKNGVNHDEEFLKKLLMMSLHQLGMTLCLKLLQSLRKITKWKKSKLSRPLL